MINLPIYNREGSEVDQIQIDEAQLGGVVRSALLKQAVVMYHANKRVGTVATKNRSLVKGSSKKLYRQKGTGRARMGRNRTVIRKGGGVAFAKTTRDFTQRMPRKQKQLARNSAVLAKLKNDDVIVIDKLEFDEPKTKEFATILDNLKIDRSCLVTVADSDKNVYLSLRNIPRVDALEVDQLNAGDVCNHRKLLFTQSALQTMLGSGEEQE